MKEWIYDEFLHCGVDYADGKVAAEYDKNHLRFRNYERDFEELLKFTAMENCQDKIFVDLGCGTGGLSLLAARHFKKVYAVDVSREMLKQAGMKLESERAQNIEFINAGFLSCQYTGPLADLVITNAALHHLPDFWKQVALLNINRMLKLDGIFYLFDVIFDFAPEAYESEIPQLLEHFGKLAGEDFKKETILHIKEEFSTFSWIIKGLIEKAGFKIVKENKRDNFTAEYMCKKTKDCLRA